METKDRREAYSQIRIFAIVAALLVVLLLGVVIYKDRLFPSLLGIGSVSDQPITRAEDFDNSFPITVLISDKYGSTVSYDYGFMENQNTLEVLIDLDDLNDDLIVEYTEDPVYGAYINNFNNYEIDTQSEFWSFLVNGRESEVGVSSYIIKPGDRIEFKITKFY